MSHNVKMTAFIGVAFIFGYVTFNGIRIYRRVSKMYHEVKEKDEGCGLRDGNWCVVKTSEFGVEMTYDPGHSVRIIEKIEPLVISELSIEDYTADDRKEECVVCRDRAKNTTLLPCHHQCVCHTCSGYLKDICPICFSKITSTVVSYKS